MIKSRLSETDSNRWEKCVPSSVRKHGESRLEGLERNSWLEGLSKEPLKFVEFGHLSSIILENWSHFQDLIPTQHWLKQRFDELEQSRQFIAHNRMLSDAEFRRIEMYVEDWNKQVGL